MDAEALQRYVLLCGQLLHGGLRDKPEMWVVGAGSAHWVAP